MTRPKTEIEIRLWLAEFYRVRRTGTAKVAMNAADDLLADYRGRSEQPQPAADDRLGRAAIEAMDAIIGEMREERDDTDTLIRIERAVQHYMGERWAIQRGTGK